MNEINLKCIGFILIITLGISCYSSNYSDTNPYFKPAYGEGYLMLNGRPIDLLPYAHISNWNDTTFNLILVEVDNKLFLESQLNISNIPHIISTHPIITGTGRTTEGPGALFNTYFQDGHVGGDLFRYNQLLDYSYIRLTSLDSNSKLVEGEFQLQLIRDIGHIYNPELPDTLNITGTFFTKIE